MDEYQKALNTLICKARTNESICETNKRRRMGKCVDCDWKEAKDILQTLITENASLKRTVEILDQEGVDKCNKLEAQAKRIKELEERNTPKKIITKIEEQFNECIGFIVERRCPSCECLIGRFEPLPYCPICGQALDWSEEDE